MFLFKTLNIPEDPESVILDTTRQKKKLKKIKQDKNKNKKKKKKRLVGKR